MNDSEPEHEAIRYFVRESLGCDCPDEVFENINVSTQSGLFKHASTVYEIGGRLLVAVISPVDWREIRPGLADIIDTGKQYRDQQGFNRFRLVVVTDSDDARENLPALFGTLPNNDDKTHLHVIDPELIPGNASTHTD